MSKKKLKIRIEALEGLLAGYLSRLQTLEYIQVAKKQPEVYGATSMSVGPLTLTDSIDAYRNYPGVTARRVG